MPIHEFGCPKCRRRFERIFAPGRTPASAACPRCSTRSRRLPSRFAVAGATSKSGSDDLDLTGEGDDWGGGDEEGDDAAESRDDDDF